MAGRAARRVFEKASDLVVVTTELVIAEVHEYVPEFAERYGLDVDFLHEEVDVLPLERYSESDYLTHVKEATKYLGQRDPDDVHLAALALKLDVPVWSNDRDLTELPLRIYTTAQLLKLLGI
ncbi:MAG: PIN domain-containing protein [Thermoanaerobaculia bacterium]